MITLINEAIRNAHHQALDYRERMVADPECPGLRFVADSHSGGVWVRRYKNHLGKMRQYKFGDYPEMKLNEARAYVERTRGHDRPDLVPGRVTLGELCERFLDEYVKTARKTQSQRNARSVLQRYLAPLWHTRIDKVRVHTLHEIIINVKKHAPTMALALRAELKQAWNYGLAAGWFDTPCPVSSMTGGRIRRHTRDRVLTDGEIRQLLESLGKYSPVLRDVIVLVLYTGMRSGEIIRLTAQDFELIDCILWGTLPAELSKNGQAHRVPFFGKAQNIIGLRLLNAQSDDAPLFVNDKGRAVEQVTLSREVNRLSGPRPWRLHDLRRTARTNLQRIGCPFEASEAILGHKLPGVSGVYARHRFNDEKLEWLEKLSDFYKGLQNAHISNTGRS